MRSRGVGVRAVVSIALAGTMLAGLTACNFGSPQSTLKKYDASDGVGGNLGDLEVRNALLVTQDGTRATLVVSVVNQTDTARTLEIQYASTTPTSTAAASATPAASDRASVTVLVNARSITQIGDGRSPQVVLEGIDAPAGSILPVYFQTGSSQGRQLDVPVLDGTLTSYTTLLPSPSPTPTPTPTPTPSIVATPTPTGSPTATPTPTAG